MPIHSPYQDLLEDLVEDSPLLLFIVRLRLVDSNSPSCCCSRESNVQLAVREDGRTKDDAHLNQNNENIESASVFYHFYVNINTPDYICTFFNDCPCALLTVIAYARRTGNWRRVKQWEGSVWSLGSMRIFGMRTVSPSCLPAVMISQVSSWTKKVCTQSKPCSHRAIFNLHVRSLPSLAVSCRCIAPCWRWDCEVAWRHIPADMLYHCNDTTVNDIMFLQSVIRIYSPFSVSTRAAAVQSEWSCCTLPWVAPCTVTPYCTCRRCDSRRVPRRAYPEPERYAHSQ